MLVEWELTLYCNFKCRYCGRRFKYRQIPPETDRNKLKDFIQNELKAYRHVELFCFGGEPTLHPEFAFIIETLINAQQPFVIQTNASDVAVSKLMELKDNLVLQLSFHPSQISVKSFIRNVYQLLSKHTIRRIDLMFDSSKCIKHYKLMRSYIPDDIDIQLSPIGDFLTYGFKDALKTFNKLKKQFHPKIKFETTFVTFEGKLYDKSYLWEMMHDGLCTTFGKPCQYKDRYILYDPQLRKFTCSYGSGSYDICPFKKCFFM